MTRDLLVVLSLSALGGLLACVHVSLLAGLFARPPRWRGYLALVLPVVAPIMAARAGMRRRAASWGALVLAYLALRALFPG